MLSRPSQLVRSSVANQSSLIKCLGWPNLHPRQTAFTAAVTTAARQCPKQHRCRPLKSVWDDSLTLSDLRQKLDAAVAAEDYAEAARLRDTLQ